MTDRQSMGCAYEPPSTTAAPLYVLMRGTVPMLSRSPSTCPLYLARIPAQNEVAAALPHWRNGSLASWCEDEPTRALQTACAELAAGLDEYAADPNRPKGDA